MAAQHQQNSTGVTSQAAHQLLATLPPVHHTQVPGLAVVIVGERKDSQTYVRMKRKACEEVGIASFGADLPDTATQQEVLEMVQQLNANPDVHGILVQLPVREQEGCVWGGGAAQQPQGPSTRAQGTRGRCSGQRSPSAALTTAFPTGHCGGLQHTHTHSLPPCCACVCACLPACLPLCTAAAAHRRAAGAVSHISRKGRGRVPPPQHGTAVHEGAAVCGCVCLVC